MIPLPDWASRKFSFDFSYEVFPGIIERLRGTPARIADRAGALPPLLLTRRDGDDWSIQEHTGHLYDLCELDLGRLADFRDGVEVLRAADMGNQKTYRADHNADTFANILTSFRRERDLLVSKLEALDADFIQRTALHPRLQVPVRVVDWCFFVAEHDDHHVAFISYLINKFAGNVSS